MQPLEFMGSTLSKVKGFFASERDSEASTRANTKTNAKPIPVTPIRRTQSIDSPRAARALSENGTAVPGSPGSKKQKIKRQVSFNRTVKERVFFEETVSDDEGGRSSPVSRPFTEKHPVSSRLSQGEVFRGFGQPL